MGSRDEDYLKNLDASNSSSIIAAKLANDKGLFYHTNEAVENFMATSTDANTYLRPAYLNDAKLSGFKLFFHFDAKSGLLAKQGYINSALAYLRRIGEVERWNKLKSFIYLLSDMNANMPWMFQSIEEGLSEIWSKANSEVYSEQIIKINTLETIDDKMKGLMLQYREIAFDKKRGVWVLPANLREFSMSIFVYDYRVFNAEANNFEFQAQNGGFVVQTADNLDIKTTNHTLFDLGYCEFMNESSSEAFTEVSNIGSTFITGSMHIRTKQYALSGMHYSIFNDNKVTEIEDNFVTGALSSRDGGIVPKNLTDWKSWKNNLQKDLIKRAKESEWTKLGKEKYDFLTNPETWRRELGNVVETGLNTIQDKIENQIAGLYLGNVHGFSLGDVLQIGDSKSVLNDLKNIRQHTKELHSLSLDDDMIQQPGLLGSSISSKDISQFLDDDMKQAPGSLGQI